MLHKSNVYPDGRFLLGGSQIYYIFVQHMLYVLDFGGSQHFKYVIQCGYLSCHSNTLRVSFRCGLGTACTWKYLLIV